MEKKAAIIIEFGIHTCKLFILWLYRNIGCNYYMEIEGVLFSPFLGKTLVLCLAN